MTSLRLDLCDLWVNKRAVFRGIINVCYWNLICYKNYAQDGHVKWFAVYYIKQTVGIFQNVTSEYNRNAFENLGRLRIWSGLYEKS